MEFRMHRLRISSLFFLLLTILLTGCSYNGRATAGTGTVNIKYDGETGICEISLSYRGNNYKHSFVVDQTEDGQAERLEVYAIGKDRFSLDLDHDAYSTSGGCIASPMEEYARKPIIDDAVISFILPSPTLNVKDGGYVGEKVISGKVISGTTPEELVDRGFTVHFNKSPQIARTSLPKLIDASSIYFSDSYLKVRSASSIAGIKLNRGGLSCGSSRVDILGGTLEVPPVDQQLKDKNKNNIENQLYPSYFVERWEFRGVVSGYSC